MFNQFAEVARSLTQTKTQHLHSISNMKHFSRRQQQHSMLSTTIHCLKRKSNIQICPTLFFMHNTPSPSSSSYTTRLYASSSSSSSSSPSSNNKSNELTRPHMKPMNPTTVLNNDVTLFKKPIQKNSDLLLRDISFIVKDSDSNRTEATTNEQDRKNMLVYALRPISLTDSQRRDVVLSEPYSYLSKRIIQPKQLNILKRWIQTNCFGHVFNASELIDPHLVKCFISRTMLKKRERNLVYEFNRSNLQLEMQGLSHLDYVISRYLHEFQSALLNTIENSNDDADDDSKSMSNIYATEQITHVKSLMMQSDILSIYAKKIGLDEDLLAHFQDIPQQRTGVDILAALIAQTSYLLGIEKSRLFLNRFMIPQLLQILEENPVPEIRTEDLVRQLSREIYRQDPTIQTREYSRKKSSSSVFTTLIIVNGMIKGQGISKSMDQAKTLALRNAYEQLKSETSNLIQ